MPLSHRPCARFYASHAIAPHGSLFAELHAGVGCAMKRIMAFLAQVERSCINSLTLRAVMRLPNGSTLKAKH
jgi:hypothetical protein